MIPALACDVTSAPQAKCLDAKANQIEDLLVEAEEHLESRQLERLATAFPGVSSGLEESRAPRRRLVFRRRAQQSGWSLWSILSGSGGGKARRRATPKGVLHQIAAETTSLAAVPTADLTLEIIRRTLGIELPEQIGQGGGDRTRGSTRGGKNRGDGLENSPKAAPLTWDLIEAAFQPVAEKGAGQEATGLSSRLDRGGMHSHALHLLARVRALEGRGLEAGIRVPADVMALAWAVKDMEVRRIVMRAASEQR